MKSLLVATLGAVALMSGVEAQRGDRDDEGNVRRRNGRGGGRGDDDDFRP